MNATLTRVLRSLLAPAIALLVAMLVTSVVVVLSGVQLSTFLEVMFAAPQPRQWVNIVDQGAMLFLSALAAAIGFRMNLFNIGVEGQYTIASFAAASVAGAALLPGLANVLLALLVAVLVGGAWAGIAGVLKVTRGVSEVISTIMLNAIALTMVGYFLNTYGNQYGQGRRTTPVPSDSRLTGFFLFTENDGPVWTLVVLAVLAGIGVSFLINRTTFGFDLRATGANEAAAVASGVKVKQMVVLSMVLSGGIAGLIWMPALFGEAGYYGPPFQYGLGFTGIAVALLGRNQPIGILFGAALFAWLGELVNPLSFAGVAPSIVQITQGVAVLAVVIAYEVVRRWFAVRDQRALQEQLVTPESEEQGAPA